MHRNIKLSTTLAIIIISTTITAQANKLYLRTDIGYSYTSRLKDSSPGSTTNYYMNKHANSQVFNLGLGSYLTSTIRSDLTLSYRNNYKYKYVKDNSFTQQKFSTLLLHLNGYYDLKTNSKFTPYLMGGIGIGRIKESNHIITQANSTNSLESTGKPQINFTWNLGVGNSIKIANNLNLDIHYKYLDMGKTKTTANPALLVTDPQLKFLRTHIKAHEILIGLRYSF